jgi:hypothetical protein
MNAYLPNLGAFRQNLLLHRTYTVRLRSRTRLKTQTFIK